MDSSSQWAAAAEDQAMMLIRTCTHAGNEDIPGMQDGVKHSPDLFMVHFIDNVLTKHIFLPDSTWQHIRTGS